MRTLTLVVPTYQRREPLLGLLDSLREQLAREPGTDVLVIEDGSTDGTAAAVEALEYPVPLTVVRQANAGLAAARNTGLERARGELVWFLDDDMVAGAGLVAAHRAAHADGRRRMVIGPCLLPAGARSVETVREWADTKHAALASTDRLADAAYFSAANTSAPIGLWRDVGGFDPAFVGWGGEDYEIAVRLLAAGVNVAFAAEAVAWHHQDRGIRGFCATKRDEGRNTVRIVRKHPATATELLPPIGGRLARALRAVPGRRPGAYAALASLAGLGARVAPGRARRRALTLAGRLSFVAGVAELDRGYVGRLLGAEPIRRDSRQPRNNPTGSQ
jgi:GT2 family glycosyltransferase